MKASHTTILDPEALAVMLGALGHAAGGQLQVLFRLDMSEVAELRARRIFSAFESLALNLPPDRVPDAGLYAALRELHARSACLPGLVTAIRAQGVSPRAYLARVAAEEEEPLLLLPASAS